MAACNLMAPRQNSTTDVNAAVTTKPTANSPMSATPTWRRMRYTNGTEAMPPAAMVNAIATRDTSGRAVFHAPSIATRSRLGSMSYTG